LALIKRRKIAKPFQNANWPRIGNNFSNSVTVILEAGMQTLLYFFSGGVDGFQGGVSPPEGGGRKNH